MALPILFSAAQCLAGRQSAAADRAAAAAASQSHSGVDRLQASNIHVYR